MGSMVKVDMLLMSHTVVLPVNPNILPLPLLTNQFPHMPLPPNQPMKVKIPFHKSNSLSTFFSTPSMIGFLKAQSNFSIFIFPLFYFAYISLYYRSFNLFGIKEL